ncbi:MAG: hypothetical protein R3A47_09330 [Polyangiales bacterium]
MPNTAFIKAAKGYWDALGQPGEPPELDDSRLDAFIDLLHLTADREHAFELLEILPNSYLALSVGDKSQPWRLHWAIQLSELEAFQSPLLAGKIFLVDSIADLHGSHRVYVYEKETRGEYGFPSLSAALRWMTAVVQNANSEINTSRLQTTLDRESSMLDDPWEDDATSGWFVFDELIHAPFPEAWDAISRGQWPAIEESGSNAPIDREDGWQRRLSLWALMRFLATRRVEFPQDVSVSEMDAVHRELISNLYDFEQAIHAGDVPPAVQQAAASEDVSLRKLASAWVERHDSWRTASVVREPDDDDDEFGEAEVVQFQHTPFTRKLMAALSNTLDDMIAREEIELDLDRKDALLIELVSAASDARSVKHMLKKLTATLVDSELVDEIYASDDQISDRFKRDLGA